MTIDISKSGGAAAVGHSGGAQAATIQLDPDKWFVSFFRALRYYIESNVDKDIYQVIPGWPPDEIFSSANPFDRTIIHFEIDDVQTAVLGMGDNVVNEVYNDETFTVEEHEGIENFVNVDIGVWASYESGGATARLNAYQLLHHIFGGVEAFRNMRDITSIEIRSFNGGQFVTETINDLPVFRIQGITLVLRIFSRRIQRPIPYIGNFDFNYEMEFSDLVIIEEE